MKKIFETNEERLKKTKEFYNNQGIDITDFEELAIQSLTMPQYAKEYNDVYEAQIKDNTSLATLGDAVCGVYLMNREFNPIITKDELSKEKDKISNESMNPIGKELLFNHMFKRNNDENGFVKSDATNFEAYIGFIYKIDSKKAFEELDKYIKKN